VVHAVLFGIALGPKIALTNKWDNIDWNDNTTAVGPAPPTSATPFTDGEDQYEESMTEPFLSPVARMVIALLSQLLIVSPLTASCFMAVFAALRTNAHLKFAHFFSAFKCSYYFKLLALSLLVHIGRTLGFHLLVIPGIWFSVISAFALPLHVEHRFLGACTAIKASHKILRSYFWNFLGFALLLILFNFGGLLLLGVGILVTLPISFFALCSCYNHLVGVNGCPVMVPVGSFPQPQQQPPQQQQTPQQLQPQPQLHLQHQQPLQQPVVFSQVPPTPLPPVAAPVSFLPRFGFHYTQLPQSTSSNTITPQPTTFTTTSQYVASPTPTNLYTPTSVPPSSVNVYPGQL